MKRKPSAGSAACVEYRPATRRLFFCTVSHPHFQTSKLFLTRDFDFPMLQGTSGEMASNGTDPEAESNQAANGGAVIRSLGDTGNNQGGSIREEDLSMDAIGPSARCQAVITLLGVHS
jgi:hypothetical protein